MRSCRIAGGIRNLPRAILAAAADVGQVVSIGRKAELANFLSVVFHIRREAPSCVRRAFSDPHVTLAVFIEGPGDATASFCGDEIFRKWRAENLFESKRRLGERTHRNKQN